MEHAKLKTKAALHPLDIIYGVHQDSEEEVSRLSQFIERQFSAKPARALKILEAGCGQKWALNLKGLTYSLTGIDQSEQAITERQTTRGDLDEVIIGDLVTARFPEQHFDVIYCSYVLEHVNGAEKVMENFFSWLRPGGLMILRIPDPSTAYSFLAQHLPFYLHVLAKRLMGSMNAGKPGYDPFPTFFDPIVSREGIHDFCQKKGLEVRIEYSYGFTTFRPFFPVADLILRILGWMSFGKLDSKRTDLLFVIEKTI